VRRFSLLVCHDLAVHHSKEPLICAQAYWCGLNQFLFNLNGGLIYAKFGEVHGWILVNWIGDGSELRDEVIVWNENYLIVYTQDKRIKGKVYKPKRKLYNQTFYGNGNFVSTPN